MTTYISKSLPEKMQIGVFLLAQTVKIADYES